MKTVLKPVITISLVALFLVAPEFMSGKNAENGKQLFTAAGPEVAAAPASRSIKEIAFALYDSMNLQQIGLSKAAFEYAWKGYQYLLHKNLLFRTDILSICDFSQSSRYKRLYIIDVKNMQLLLNTYVAHGKNSGGEYAKSFSNTLESHKSSLGFYRTSRTYYGEHGLALKVEGLERGINDKANARNIVVHGSHYVGDDYIRSNKFNGRSFGCPAVPGKQASKVINTIKDGTCLFIYHPTKKYISKSKILNG